MNLHALRQLASALKFIARCQLRGVRNADELGRYVEMTGGLRVLSGPFSGMKYARHSSGSAWAPKILGTYEKEIANLVTSLDLGTYDAVVDVGCAEGYYLAGLGYRAMKCGYEVELIGYDTNKQAVAIATYLTLLNGIRASIHLERYSFDEHQSKRCLFIIDIEGGEEDLFRRFSASDWATSDFLVEIHDELNASARLNLITSHLAPTHDIDIFTRRERTPLDFPSRAVPAGNDVKVMLMNEYRQFGNKWVFAGSRQPQSWR